MSLVFFSCLPTNLAQETLPRTIRNLTLSYLSRKSAAVQSHGTPGFHPMFFPNSPFIKNDQINNPQMLHGAGIIDLHLPHRCPSFNKHIFHGSHLGSPGPAWRQRWSQDTTTVLAGTLAPQVNSLPAVTQANLFLNELRPIGESWDNHHGLGLFNIL